MMPQNEVRGETVLHFGGQSYVLCLTLGALAEIESALGLASFAEFSRRSNSLSANEVLAILQALLKGGGNPVSQQELCAASLEPQTIAEVIAKAFEPVAGTK